MVMFEIVFTSQLLKCEFQKLLVKMWISTMKRIIWFVKRRKNMAPRIIRRRWSPAAWVPNQILEHCFFNWLWVFVIMDQVCLSSLLCLSVSMAPKTSSRSLRSPLLPRLHPSWLSRISSAEATQSPSIALCHRETRARLSCCSLPVLLAPGTCPGLI